MSENGKKIQFFVGCTEELKARLTIAAEAEGLTLSAWVRKVCIHEVNRLESSDAVPR